MKFLRIIFTLGYLFWGFMLFQAIGELMLRNAWFEIFEIQKVNPKEIEFIPLERETTDIKYSFEYNNQIYTGSRKVNNRIVEERLPPDKNDIEISFNTRFPNANYLDQLGLKTRSGNVGIVISLIFLAFFGLIDLIGNKRKWLKIYGIEIKN